MITSLNRQNTNFQLAYFIAGSCHTPDAAYFALLNQRYDRQQAILTAESYALKRQAQRIRAERDLESDDPAVVLEAQAELMELANAEAQHDTLMAAAVAEKEFIETCMARLQPLRKYSHLPDAEASEAYQSEEWALEMRYRAENFLLTQGTIPSDHFASMRQHPDFATKILPYVDTVHQALRSGQSVELLNNLKPEYDIPAMLGMTDQKFIK